MLGCGWGWGRPGGRETADANTCRVEKFAQRVLAFEQSSSRTRLTLWKENLRRWLIKHKASL